MYNKLTSDVVTTIVGMAKGQKPTVNEVKSNHKEVTGTGIPNSRITVILPNGIRHVSNVESNGTYRVIIENQQENAKISVTQKTPRRLESDPVETTVVRAIPAPNPTINEVDTDDTRVTGKGVPNSKVYVKIPGKVEKHVDVNGNGDWSLDTGLLNAGQGIIVHQELPDRPNSEEVRKNVVQLPALRTSKNRLCRFKS